MTPSSVTVIATAQSQVVEEQVFFSFTALCNASGANDSQLRALVAEGLLEPSGDGPADWQFNGPSLLRTRSALRLMRELELNLHAAAIVMDLLAEIEQLKSRTGSYK
jgi:chaperone modulatory protein CbpM